MFPRSTRESRETFWKTFGRYMALVPSASGERINWINYKTGVKAVRFSLDVNNNLATVSITVSDEEVFAKLLSLRGLFIAIAGDDWLWSHDGISVQVTGKDIRNEEDWPELITFFKQRLTALDAFWVEVKDLFI